MLLSEAYENSAVKTYAICKFCGLAWEDDMPLYGSLFCPVCRDKGVVGCLFRGVKKEDLSTHGVVEAVKCMPGAGVTHLGVDHAASAGSVSVPVRRWSQANGMASTTEAEDAAK